MTRLFKMLIIITSLFFFSINIYADTKQAINVSGMEWNYSEFVYDNTLKTVELINVPSNITITYENNSFKDVGTYFARAYLSYDNTKFYITGYDPDKFESHCWTIVRGKYNTNNMIFKDTRIVYDGKPHEVTPKVSGNVSIYDSETMKVLYNDETKPTNAGTYPVTITALIKTDISEPVEIEYNENVILIINYLVC